MLPEEVRIKGRYSHTNVVNEVLKSATFQPCWTLSRLVTEIQYPQVPHPQIQPPMDEKYWGGEAVSRKLQTLGSSRWDSLVPSPGNFHMPWVGPLKEKKKKKERKKDPNTKTWICHILATIDNSVYIVLGIVSNLEMI